MYQRMMDDISKQIKAGEVSGVQFKERILDKYDIACELVAFSNSHGGKLVVGIKDRIRPEKPMPCRILRYKKQPTC